MKIPNLAILKVESHPQGVIFKVLATFRGMTGAYDLDLGVAQIADGTLRMTYRVLTPWRVFDAANPVVVDDDQDVLLVAKAAHRLIMPIAQSIWETLPTYNKLDAQKPQKPQETPETEGATGATPNQEAAGEPTGESDDG